LSFAKTNLIIGQLQIRPFVPENIAQILIKGLLAAKKASARSKIGQVEGPVYK